MANERAAGDGWKVLAEGDKTYLQLHSIYGIIEVKTCTLIGLELVESIVQNYDDLKAQGPIKAEASLAFCLMCGNPVSDYTIAEDICPACLPIWTKAVYCLEGWRTLSPFEITEQLAPLYLYDAATGKSKAEQEVRA